MYQRISLMLIQDQKENEVYEKNQTQCGFGEETSSDEYILDPTEEYVIDLEEEMELQMATMMSFQIMGPPPALKNYHAWLFENGFSVEMPNPTNEVVARYYGVSPLWKTGYSQGIVVKAENESDYYIIMECSSKNKGYKRTQVILTMGGCM